MIYLFYFFTPLILVMILSPWAISFSREWALMDHPDSRKLHGAPTPLAGGLILFPFVVTGSLISFYANGNVSYVLAGTTLIFGLGIWDDRFGSHFFSKFLVQIIAALVVMQSGLLFDLNRVFPLYFLDLELGRFFSMAITLLWIVGVTNAVNIIDGMDGLAGGLCFNAFAGMGALALVSGRNDLAVFCIIMSGTLTGLLRYNIYPARTFLGDSGSMLLGFTLAVVSIIQSYKTTTFLVLVVPALFLALPVLDTVFAFARRGMKGQNPFKADREHLHHRLLGLNFTQIQTLGVFFSLSAGLGLVALWLAQTGQVHAFALAVFILVLIILVIKGLQIFNFHLTVQKMNVRMRELAKRAVEKERAGEERLTRNLAILAVLCALNAAMALWPSRGEGSPVLAGAALAFFAVGCVDVFLNRREIEPRFEILHVVLFLSLVLNQIAILALWHRDYLVAPHFAASAFLLLVILGVFVYRTGTFAVFLQDPMEILALFGGIVLCGISKHFLAAPAILPFAVVIANALVLYILLKVYLVGYRIRSLAYSLGFTGCVALLVSVPWWK